MSKHDRQQFLGQVSNDLTRRDFGLRDSLIPAAYQQMQQGRMSRREFLRIATLLGFSAGVASFLAACGLGPNSEKSEPLSNAGGENPQEGLGQKISETPTAVVVGEIGFLNTEGVIGAIDAYEARESNQPYARLVLAQNQIEQIGAESVGKYPGLTQEAYDSNQIVSSGLLFRRQDGNFHGGVYRLDVLGDSDEAGNEILAAMVFGVDNTNGNKLAPLTPESPYYAVVPLEKRGDGYVYLRGDNEPFYVPTVGEDGELESLSMNLPFGNGMRSLVDVTQYALSDPSRFEGILPVRAKVIDQPQPPAEPTSEVVTEEAPEITAEEVAADHGLIKRDGWDFTYYELKNREGDVIGKYVQQRNLENGKFINPLKNVDGNWVETPDEELEIKYGGLVPPGYISPPSVSTGEIHAINKANYGVTDFKYLELGLIETGDPVEEETLLAPDGKIRSVQVMRGVFRDPTGVLRLIEVVVDLSDRDGYEYVLFYRNDPSEPNKPPFSDSGSVNGIRCIFDFEDIRHYFESPGQRVIINFAFQKPEGYTRREQIHIPASGLYKGWSDTLPVMSHYQMNDPHRKELVDDMLNGRPVDGMPGLLFSDRVDIMFPSGVYAEICP